DVENELMFDAPSFLNINLPKSQRQGFIADALFSLHQRVSLRTNYTYTDAALSSGVFAGNSVPYVARNTANIALMVQAADALTATLDANYTGSRYLIGDDANTADKVDSLTLINANVLWAWT